MNTTNKVLIGALSGLAAGVLVGMLTAPEKGKDTRDKISRQADKLRKKFIKMRNQAGDDLDELEEVFNHEISGLKDDVRQRVLGMIASRKNKTTPEPSLS